MPTTPLSSWNGGMPVGVALDSGVIYIGSSIFAAQDGGLKYSDGKVRRQIMFDGQHSAIAGLDRTVEFKPVISGSIIQVPAASLESMEPGFITTAIAGSPTGLTTSVQPKSAGVLYAAGDYLANVRAIWMMGDGTYFQIRFPKAYVAKWDVAGVDKVEGKWAIELEARLDMAASGVHVYDPPMAYEYFTAAP